MEKRASWALVALLASLAASPARADLTVVFATDGPRPALSVSVVREPRPEAEPAPEIAPEPTTEAAPVAVSAPTPAPIAPAPIAVAPSEPAPGPVEARFVRVGDGSGESATLVLRDARGDAGAGVLDRLSVLARPRGTDAPATMETEGDFVAPGIRRLHAGLLPLLARLASHFPGREIQIVSGYRPNAREGSRHRFGRAIDLRIDGVPIEEVRAYLDGEPGTGVGFYPVSGFVHLDVRSESVRWVDDSGPGQAPHVVRSDVVERSDVAARETAAPSTPPGSAPVEGGVDTDAIERAMRAADAITLDLGLPR